MKKFLFTALLALLAAGVGAQEQQKQKEEGYRFTDVKLSLIHISEPTRRS